MEIKDCGTVVINNDDDEQIQIIEHGKLNKISRFHLPVLKLNKPEEWASKDEPREAFVGDVAANCCLNNCCGVAGLKSACCMLDPTNLEHVLGPVDDLWIKSFLNSSKAKQAGYKRIDVVIDYEEGKVLGDKFFPGYDVFHSEKSYPMLRFVVYGPRFCCRFLNPETGKCRIYDPNRVKDLRPEMCQTYLCQYIKCNYLVKQPNKPNLLLKIR